MMRNVFIIAQDCSFRMSDLRCIIGHMDRLAELALKWGTIKVSPLPEPEPKKSIRGLELNPCGVGNFILSFSFRRKSGGGRNAMIGPLTFSWRSTPMAMSNPAKQIILPPTQILPPNLSGVGLRESLLGKTVLAPNAPVAYLVRLPRPSIN